LNKKTNRKKELFVVFTVLIMLLGAILPITNASRTDYIKGFSQGPSYTNVVSMKKVTMVKYDDESYLDDYAYLAAVPTAVFKDQDPNYDRLFSHPLLRASDFQTSLRGDTTVFPV
jgi:hypothetical protein